MLKNLLLTGGLLALAACATDSTVDVPSSNGSELADEAKALMGDSPIPSPLALAADKPTPAPKLPPIDHAALQSPDRPSLNFFGATVHADTIDPATGQAQGRVYLDGRVLHQANPRFPQYVYCDHLRVDATKGEVEISGMPVMKWQNAYVIAKDSSTRIHLTKDQYKVMGPAQYGVAPAG